MLTVCWQAAWWSAGGYVPTGAEQMSAEFALADVDRSLPILLESQQIKSPNSGSRTPRNSTENKESHPAQIAKKFNFAKPKNRRRNPKA